MLGGLPRSAADGKIDYSADFFGKPAFLTVSGQLNGEGERFSFRFFEIFVVSPKNFRRKKKKVLNPLDP